MMGLLHFESDSGKQEESISNLKTKNKHSVRTPTETFFIFTFGLGQSNWADKFWGIWGIFGQTISTHFGTVSPLFMFSIIQPLFLQKTKPLNPHPK